MAAKSRSILVPSSSTCKPQRIIDDKCSNIPGSSHNHPLFTLITCSDWYSNNHNLLSGNNMLICQSTRKSSSYFQVLSKGKNHWALVHMAWLLSVLHGSNTEAGLYKLALTVPCKSSRLTVTQTRRLFQEEIEFGLTNASWETSLCRRRCGLVNLCYIAH